MCVELTLHNYSWGGKAMGFKVYLTGIRSMLMHVHIFSSYGTIILHSFKYCLPRPSY